MVCACDEVCVAGISGGAAVVADTEEADDEEGPVIVAETVSAGFAPTGNMASGPGYTMRGVTDVTVTDSFETLDLHEISWQVDEEKKESDVLTKQADLERWKEAKRRAQS
jgi:hypothetical protein